MAADGGSRKKNKNKQDQSSVNEWFFERLCFLFTTWSANLQEKNFTNIPQHGPCTSSIILVFSPQSGETQIKISSTRPSNKLAIGATTHLTCLAWQTDELAQNPRTRPFGNEWFEPQDKRIGF